MKRLVGRDMDQRIGTRIRMARVTRGLSQTQLGEGLGVSFQQVQKYENGRDRVAASTLAQIADLCEQPIAAFFDEGQMTVDIKVMRQATKIAADLGRIPRPRIRACLTGLIGAVARQGSSFDEQPTGRPPPGDLMRR